MFVLSHGVEHGTTSWQAMHCIGDVGQEYHSRRHNDQLLIFHVIHLETLPEAGCTHNDEFPYIDFALYLILLLKYEIDFKGCCISGLSLLALCRNFAPTRWISMIGWKRIQ